MTPTPAVLLAAAGALAAGPVIAGTPAVTGSQSACRTIEADADRLRCYDALAVPASPPSSSPVPAPKPVPAPAATDLFGRPPAEAQRVVEQQLGVAEELDAVVTACGRSPTGKLQFTLDNGQHWVQADTTSANCAAGDPIRIRRASLGSYLLRKNAGGPGIRVRRAD